MDDDIRVRRYFIDTSTDFDGIYDNRGSAFNKLVNTVFRKGMGVRAKLTLEACDPGKTLLDVGCGSGRISLPLAQKGLRVTGVDFSNTMIDMAGEYSKAFEQWSGSRLDIRFLCMDFMKEFYEPNKYDITIAIGVLDYVNEPLDILRRMKEYTKEKMIVSYPAIYSPQSPIRKVWLWTKGCPVYYYNKKRLRSIYDTLGMDYNIIDIPAGFLAISRPR
ncbi:MAG TPA: class I SAM-dependent methyltransferase [Methanocella sp.]|nr:class I SAM-dependent methyltransferase [Methanocella sp.]